jgi:dTDP-glucose pyrophosphorylase/CBS domain-containing protein
MIRPLDPLLVPPTATVRETMAAIDRNEVGIALVVDERRRLLATITDGDLRRAMLADLDIEAPVSTLVDARRARGEPIVAPAGTPPLELLALMERESVRQVPLLDGDGRIVDLALLDDVVKTDVSPLRAVVMAGGFGTRLGDLTADTPKPMLPVGDRPLLERIIGQLREAGINRVSLTTHYRADSIAGHFGDGSEFGVDLHYVNEDTPLGTAGSLALLEPSVEPILVMNGDIVTRVNFAAMHRFHEEHRADMTVALRPYETSVPYGVVEVDGELITDVAEKPLVRAFVNAGIYLLAPDVCRLVPAGTRYEMTDLIRALIAAGRRVVGFPLREYWLDIGTPEDYSQALNDAHDR